MRRVTEAGKETLTIPNHKQLDTGTCRAILRQASRYISFLDRRIAGLYNQGNNAEEIARRLNHLTITQIYAALTYYHANRITIDRDIADEQNSYEELAKQNTKKEKKTRTLHLQGRYDNINIRRIVYE